MSVLEFSDDNYDIDFDADGLDKGIIPLTCSELFDRVSSKKEADPHITFTVEVSYIEVCKLFLLHLSCLK